MSIVRDVQEARHAIQADMSRVESGGASRSVVLFVFRLGQLIERRQRRGMLRLLWRCADLIFLRAILGTELPAQVTAGPGLSLTHSARGITLDPDVMIGADVIIHPYTTIGRDGRSHAPRVGDHVTIGTGARIIGPITVGDRATIGANSVVLRDVPPDSIAIGVPARILRAPQDPETPALG